MSKNRFSGIETYGLAAMGFARGIFELVRDEAKEFVHDKRIEDAPSIGHVALMEKPDELQKAA